MVEPQSPIPDLTREAFLVSNFYNILYLSAFETLSPHEREAYLLIIKGRKIIITDARYKGESHSSDSKLYILQQGERVGDVISQLCKAAGIKKLGFETTDLKWSEALMLQKIGLELDNQSNHFVSDRSIKSEEEIFAIKQACHIGDLVLKDITPYIHPGQTEKEIAWFIERSIREGYKAELAFDPIVAVDKNSAIPHYNTKKGDGVIMENSILLLDFGVKQHNYCSDITRMIAFGDVTQEIVNTYNDLLSAQKRTVTSVGTTAQLKEVDFFCREELKKGNHPNYPHSTGHGIGLEVHEFPRISAVSEDIKKQGQVFTIEPGVYHHGKWGMRVEDTVVILDQGEIEVLTRFPKDLIRL